MKKFFGVNFKEIKRVRNYGKDTEQTISVTSVISKGDKVLVKMKDGKRFTGVFQRTYLPSEFSPNRIYEFLINHGTIIGLMDDEISLIENIE